MRLGLIVALLVLAGCGRERDDVRQAPPADAAARIIPTPVEVYVQIDPEMTERCPWKRDCVPREGMACAKERAKCLERYEQQFDAIEKVEGTPVPDKAGASDR